MWPFPKKIAPPSSANEVHPGPPTVQYASNVDPDTCDIEVSFGDRLALIFSIWGDGEAITVETIKNSHVDFTAFREAFTRYAAEAESWAENLRQAALAEATEAETSSASGSPKSD